MPSNNRGNNKNNRRKGNSGKRRSRQPKTGLKPEEGYEYGSFSFDEYSPETPFGGLMNDSGYQNPFKRGETPQAGQEPQQEVKPEVKLSKAEEKRLAKLEARRQKIIRDRDNVTITALNRNRLAAGMAVLLLLMIALIFRMGYWQIIRADELKVMAVSMQKIDAEIDPVRGTIYDSKMGPLAETMTEYALYGYTQNLYKSTKLNNNERKATVKDMAEITGLSEVEVRKRFRVEENLALIAEGLTKEQVEKAEKRWEGNVIVKTKVTRYYPNGSFAAQVLGGVNSENIGRSGLEYEYNSVLAGVKGRTVRTTDRDGNTLSGNNSRYYDAQDGNSIVTTIDSVLQHFVEEAIEKGMKKTGAKAITCIVTDPKTGNILAMATTPGYDPNNSSAPSDPAELEKFEKMTDAEKTEYLSRMWTIRGISNVYEPGSTFKLIAAAAALDSASADSKSRYTCKGSIRVANYNLHCLGVHGKQTLKEAVGNSCNPAMAKVALDMGAETFYNYIDMFGFNDKTGVDLPGETDSIVKDIDGMGDVDLATTGYGQGIAVTPLQILCAVNALGNDGVLMKPKIVKEIVNSKGETVRTIPDTAVRQVVSKETADEMRDIMEYYVSDAGGNKAYVPGFRIGGKTGTANLVQNGAYSAKETNTSFVAMAPMDDPKISMIVIVYSPTKIQYGNLTAGPIVKDIMEEALQYMGVERKYTEDEEKEVKKNMVKVPDITGMDSKDAIAALKAKDLKYLIKPDDTPEGSFVVIDQFPKAGTRVDKKSSVYIYSQ